MLIDIQNKPDKAVLSDLKAMWRRRLEESKALEDRKMQSQDQVSRFFIFLQRCNFVYYLFQTYNLGDVCLYAKK